MLPNCKGDWSLGSACGTCLQCIETKPEGLGTDFVFDQNGYRVAIYRPASTNFRDLAANAADALQSLLDQLKAAKARVNALEAALLMQSGPDPVLPIDMTVQEMVQVHAFVRGMRAVRA